MCHRCGCSADRLARRRLRAAGSRRRPFRSRSMTRFVADWKPAIDSPKRSRAAKPPRLSPTSGTPCSCRRWRHRPATRGPITFRSSGCRCRTTSFASSIPTFPTISARDSMSSGPCIRADAWQRSSMPRETEAAALTDELDAARSDLRLEITRAYWSLLTAAETARVVDESLVRTRAHLVDARNQLDAGLAAPNDVLAVEAQESRQRMLGIQARANRDVARSGVGSARRPRRRVLRFGRP